MGKSFTIERILLLSTVITAFMVVFVGTSYAQDCDDTVPVVNVDLSGDPAGTFFSPSIVREGNCCGTTAPDRCVAFVVTLNPGAQGISFDICDGAVPPGALFYQIDCGPEVQVGEAVCLDGAGPHYLTFCKPGNNNNVYCITSIPAPSAGPDTLASEGCSAAISATGFDPNTITWTSVAPGIIGEYDYLMSCDSCEETTVVAPDPIVPFADFMVCGENAAGCNPITSCDTVRVYFASTLDVTVIPNPAAICFGSAGEWVYAVGSGGYPPYTYTWGNGTVSDSLFISSPGLYTVTVSDTSGCPPAQHTFEVIEYELPLEVFAGPNQIFCEPADTVFLNGSFSGIDTCRWIGGDGTFIPDRTDPQAAYIPTPDEWASGSFSLQLNLNPAGDCPGASDMVTIFYAPFTATVTADIVNNSCFDADDGSITVQVDGSQDPYTIEWSNEGLDGFAPTGLPNGDYTAVVSNNLGCADTVMYSVTEPDVLDLSLDSLLLPLCWYSADGYVELSPGGGTAPYELIWSDGQSLNAFTRDDLTLGSYTVILVDANGCSDSLDILIADPQPITLDANDAYTVCSEEVFELTAEALGGTGSLTYNWSAGMGSGPIQPVSFSEDALVTVFVTDDNGCYSDTIDITIDIVEMYPDSLFMVPDTAVCPGNEAFVYGEYLGSYGPYIYAWSGGLPDGQGPHSVNPTTDSAYLLTVTDACENSLTDSVQINILPLPMIDLPDTLFAGCSPLAIELEDELNQGFSFTHEWILDNGQILTGNPASVELTDAGVYNISLRVTNAEGCASESETSIPVEVYPVPVANFQPNTWQTRLDNPTFVFTNTTQGSYTYSLWNLEGDEFMNQESVSYTYPDTGNYDISLLVVNEYGCRDSISQTVRVEIIYDIIIPNAFTPDNEGAGGVYDPNSTSNTVFYPFSKYVSEFRMTIFNRWGEVVFESNEFERGWDGMYRGNPAPQDVYVYKLEFLFTDGYEIVKTGNITLFR